MASDNERQQPNKSLSEKMNLFLHFALPIVMHLVYAMCAQTADGCAH